jgi:hypothetical protein
MPNNRKPTADAVEILHRRRARLAASLHREASQHTCFGRAAGGWISPLEDDAEENRILRAEQEARRPGPCPPGAAR